MTILVGGRRPDQLPLTGEIDTVFTARAVKHRDEIVAGLLDVYAATDQRNRLVAKLADPTLGTPAQRSVALERERRWTVEIEQAHWHIDTWVRQLAGYLTRLSAPARTALATDWGEPSFVEGEEDVLELKIWQSFDRKPPRDPLRGSR